MITIIAAITRDRALGRNGDMLYHISADLRRFKALSMGHPVIMGRKTFESFPNGPLPGRRNMVVTRSSEYSHPGIETYGSLEQALEVAEDDAFIIGGGQIYSQAMDKAHRLEITLIDAESKDADTFFPEIDPERWRLESKSEAMTDPRSGTEFAYLTYSRITPEAD